MRTIFVNLPVKDLEAAKAFFVALGFSCNSQFSNERSACMVVEQNISIMLLQTEQFRAVITGEIADPAKGVGVITGLSCDSRQAVDDMAEAALAAGGKAWQPATDYGWMYVRTFQDLDGHVWELAYADASRMPS
jgi:uncharacterized protein